MVGPWWELHGIWRQRFARGKRFVGQKKGIQGKEVAQRQRDRFDQPQSISELEVVETSLSICAPVNTAGRSRQSTTEAVHRSKERK